MAVERSVFIVKATHYLMNGTMEGPEMANGVNHAKQIVVGQAKDLADKLSNGNAGDTQTQGQAISLVIQMLTPMYEAEFVTVQTCNGHRIDCEHSQKEAHDSIIAKIDEVVAGDRLERAESVKKGPATLKLGPLELKGSAVPIFVIIGVLLVPTVTLTFVMGKNQGWW